MRIVKTVGLLLATFLMFFVSLDIGNDAEVSAKRFKSENRGNWTDSKVKQIAWVDYKGVNGIQFGATIGTRYKTDTNGNVVYCLNWDLDSPKLNGNTYNKTSDSVTTKEYTALRRGYKGGKLSLDRTNSVYKTHNGKKYAANQRYYITQMGLYLVTTDKGTKKSNRIRPKHLMNSTRSNPLKYMSRAQSSAMLQNIKNHVTFIEKYPLSKPKSKKVSVKVENKKNNPFKVVEGKNYVQTGKLMKVVTSDEGSFTINKDGIDGATFRSKTGKKLTNKEVLGGTEFYLRKSVTGMKKSSGTVKFKVNGSVSYKKPVKYKPKKGQTGVEGKKLQRILQMDTETNTTSTTVSSKYTEPKGKLKVIKEDYDTGEKLQGAEFKVTGGKNNINKTVTTGKDGTVTLKDLGYGDYDVKETKPPKGYNNDKNEGTVKINGEKEKIFTAKNRIIPDMPPPVKTVEGKKHADVDFKKPFTYEIKVPIPEDVTLINRISFEDVLSKELENKGTRIEVDGEEIRDININETGNNITFELQKALVNKYRGKELILYIDVQVRKDVDVATIFNVPELTVNNWYKIRPDIPQVVTRTKDIEVEKKWENDHPLDRPEDITVKLHSDRTGTIEKKITKEEGWKTIFKDLPELDEDFKEVEYTLTEVKVDGYVTEIDKKGNKFIITNTWDEDVPDPDVKKDVNGKNHEEVSIGEEFDYNVKVDLPKDLRGYKTLEITDELDKRLKINSAQVLVDGKSVKKANIKGQNVDVELDRYKLEEFKGEEAVLQIKAEIREGTPIEEIDNIAELQLNDNPKIKTNTVIVKPKRIEVGFEKIQIFTDKSTKDLPVKLDLVLREENSNHVNEKLDVVLYEKESNKEVQRDTLRIKDLNKTIETTIPSKYLTKDANKNYEARIDNYDDEYILVNDADGKDGKIDTDGYTSSEKHIKLDFGNYEDTPNIDNETRDESEYKGVIKTEREFGKDMHKDWEYLTLPLDRIGKQKAGYGVEVDRDIYYKNELEDGTEIETELLVHRDLQEDHLVKEADKNKSEYTDKLGRKVEDRYIITDMESSKVSEIKNGNRTEKHTFNVPNVYVEKKTGHLSKEKEQGNANGYRNGGNKIYVPIWLENLGHYDVALRSIDTVGVHHVEFTIKDELWVNAYMYAHMRDGKASKTIKEDEILIKPANLGNMLLDGMPEGWTQGDVDWFDE